MKLFSLGIVLFVVGCSGGTTTVTKGDAGSGGGGGDYVSDGTSSGGGDDTPTTSSGGTDTGTPPNAGDLVVFTTRASFTPDFGGLDAADARCTTYANAAGWKGKFRAWLSDRTNDAIDGVPPGGPWRVVAGEGLLGKVAFADKDAWAGYPAIPLSRDEFGKAVTTTFTWTATLLGGTRVGCACGDWLVADSYVSTCYDSNEYGAWTGYPAAQHGDEGWTHSSQQFCSMNGSLICFQMP